MNQRFLCCTLICGLVLTLMPDVVFAIKGNDFGALADAGKAFESHATSLKALLFGPILRIGALFGGAVGIITSLLQGSFSKLCIYGGISLASVVLPSVIDTCFSVLLP